MILDPVADSLADLFLVYGAAPKSERFRQYLYALRDSAKCSECLLYAIAVARSGFDRMPAPKGLLGIYWPRHKDQHDRDEVLEAPYHGLIGAAHSPADDSETDFRLDFDDAVSADAGMPLDDFLRSDPDMQGRLKATEWWGESVRKLERVGPAPKKPSLDEP